jgi:hypothetical protein
MDAPEAPKAPKPKGDAREARLAQALRDNLRRRKAADAPPTPPGTREERD